MKNEKIIKFEVIENNSMFNEVLSGLSSLITEDEMIQIKAGKVAPSSGCSSCITCSSMCAACVIAVV